jgi:hypothetical protein
LRLLADLGGLPVGLVDLVGQGRPLLCDLVPGAGGRVEPLVDLPSALVERAGEGRPGEFEDHQGDDDERH